MTHSRLAATETEDRTRSASSASARGAERRIRESSRALWSVAVMMTTLLIAASGVPARSEADTLKLLVAIPNDELLQAHSESAPGLELAGPSWRTWPICTVTSEGLDWLAESGTTHVVLDCDLTRNLRALDSDMGDYHTFEETRAELENLESDYPELVEVRSIGKSIQGRDLLAAFVSGAESVEQELGACLLVGLHHAREIISTEVVLNALNFTLSQYGEDPDITYLLNHRRVIFLPMLNPDGHVRVEAGVDWRKNMRDNLDGTFGVDPNRNYGYKWGYDEIGSSSMTSSSTYRGPSPFSEPETQAIRSLKETEGYDVSLSFHSYGNIIFYPWSFDDGFTPDHEIHAKMASVISAQSGYNYGNTELMDFYPANGEFDDWNYAGLGDEQRSFGLTFEVGDSFYEPEDRIEQLCQETLDCCINAVCAAGPWLTIAQHQILEQDPDGIIRSGERFTVDLVLQSVSVDELGPVEVSCSCYSPLVSIMSPPIRFETMGPMERLGPGECYFEVQATLGETCPQIVPLLVRVQTEGFDRQFEVPVPVGLNMLERAASWYFEEDEEWSVEGDWERGKPRGAGGRVNGNPGPDIAYSGERVCGTDLEDDILGPEGRSFLISPPFSCEGLQCTRVDYQRWLNVGAADYFRASVEVYAEGRWHGVWHSLGEITDSEWTPCSLDISKWADGRDEVQLRFTVLTSGYEPYSGFFIDDVQVLGCRPPYRDDPSRKTLPFAIASSEGMLDTIIVVQNRTELPKPIELEFREHNGTLTYDSAIVNPHSLVTRLASAEMGAGWGSAVLQMQQAADFNVSAFLINLNTMRLSTIDLLRETSQTIDLHVYYTEGEGKTDSFVVLSNNSQSQESMNVQISVFRFDGSSLGSIERQLGPESVQAVSLQDACGPALGWIQVQSDIPGLGACGLMDFVGSEGLQPMKAFCNN